LPQEFWIAVAGVAGTIGAALLAGWLGDVVRRRGRGTEIERDIGVLEGRVGRGSEGTGDRDMFMLLGELREGMKNVTADLAEIRETQDRNRESARIEHVANRKQIEGLRREVAVVKRGLSRLQRRKET